MQKNLRRGPLLAAALVSVFLAGCATGPNRSAGMEGHHGHHGHHGHGKHAMGGADGQMMCPMHEKMMGSNKQGMDGMHGGMHGGMRGARTPEEQRAMMAEHIKKMPPDMLQKRMEMTQKRMDMMQAELQMMKERLAAQPAAR